jgi:phosphoribosylformylglycinamidine (FGAM) synthase-like enzyme
MVRLLGRLPGVATAAHDASVGVIGVALARMAIAAGSGAAVRLDSVRPTATLHGERVGRVIVGVASDRVPALRAVLDAEGVAGARIGTAGGSALSIAVGEAALSIEPEALASAWRTGF